MINILSLYSFLSLRSKETWYSPKSKATLILRQLYRISGLSERGRGTWHDAISKLLRGDGAVVRRDLSRKEDIHGAGLSLHLPIVLQMYFVCCTLHPIVRRDAEEPEEHVQTEHDLSKATRAVQSGHLVGLSLAASPWHRPPPQRMALSSMEHLLPSLLCPSHCRPMLSALMGLMVEGQAPAPWLMW